MKVNLSSNQIIVGIITLAIAWYVVTSEHKSSSRLDKEAHARDIQSDKQSSRDKQFYERMEHTIAQTRNNKESYAIIENQMTALELSSMALARSFDLLNEEILSMARDYLTKSEFRTAWDKYENNTTVSINRLEEVMYNDRKQTEDKISQNARGIESNTRDLQYIKGTLNTLLQPHALSPSSIRNVLVEPSHEKIILSK